jgi:O-antigen ligase
MSRGTVGASVGFERARTALLAANLAWTTLCLGGFMPATQVVMAVLTGALVAVHLLDPRRGLRAHPAGWLFVPFLAYAAANVRWVTPVRWLGWNDWLNWAQAVAVFWIVLNGVESPGCRRFLCALLVALGATAGAMACYQHFVNPAWLMLGRKQVGQFLGRSTGPFGIPNSLGVFMALLIPPVGALAFGRGRRGATRILCAGALGAIGAGFVLAVSRGAWLALAAAFVLRPLLTPGLRPGRRLAAAAASVAAAAAAVTVLYFSFPLMRIRADQLVHDLGERTRPILWRGAWRIFEAHPAVGAGAGSFDALFEPYRPEGYRDQPVYAHCDYLNTLADYGAVGFVLIFGAAAIVAWRCAGARGLASAAWTGLLAFALHLLVDFHLKIPALAMIVATVAALVVREAWPAEAAGGARPGAPGPLARVAAACAAAAIFGFTILWIVPKHRAEEYRRAARERIDKMATSGADVSHARDALTEISDELSRAVALDPSNAQAWSDKAYAESLWALVDPADTVKAGAAVVGAADRAVGLCPIIAEFWIRRGVGLDMQRRWIEGGDCFVRALQLAPTRPDVWYYQAYHLSLAPTETGPAIAAADYSLRLDPGFLFAQVLRQRLANRLQQRP